MQKRPPPGYLTLLDATEEAAALAQQWIDSGAIPKKAAEEAATVFGDPLSRTIADPLHSQDENRFVVLGQSHGRRHVVVVFTERGENIRIISARRASRGERKDYEEGIE